MSISPTDDSVPRTTPIFDETATELHLDSAPPAPPAPAADNDTSDTTRDARSQAKDTAKETAGAAKEQAQHVGSAAADAGHQVASTTKDQASKVASDAVGQARELYGQATEQLSEQAGKQQKNAASTLHTFGEDLSTMHAQGGSSGLAAELVQNLSQRAGDLADWLEQREPGEVLDEVKQFAARRPGLFIGLAAVTGIVAARAVKALTTEAKTPGPSDTAAPRAEDLGAATAPPVTDPSSTGGFR